MSKAIPTKPPQTTVHRSHVVTKTSRVPGRAVDVKPEPVSVGSTGEPDELVEP
jgi:hypothetical protein